MTSTLSLQIVIELTSAEHDSQRVLAIFWWVGQLLALPVLAVSRLLGTMGIEATHFAGSMIVTLGMALAAWSLTKAGPQRSSSAAS